MDGTELYKEVHFNEYCKSCKYKQKEEWKDPCHGCLSMPCNIASHKPMYWEEKND